MYKKLLAILTVLAVMVLSLTGCGGQTASNNSPGESSSELVVAIPEGIEGTDIAQVNWSNIVHELIYDAPVIYDLEMKELLASSATSYEVSPDGKELTFTFPEDATFSNGEPLTAEAIKESMEWYVENSPYSGDYDPIQEVIVKDPQTLVFKLEKPTAYLWSVLTSTYNGPNDAKVAEELGKEAYHRNAIGNGLYYVDEWVQGSHITLLKNPNYKTSSSVVDNKGPAKIEKITVRFIPESFTRVSEIETGSVDIIYNVPPENLAKLENNADIELYKFLQSGIDYISINPKVEHLNDVKVRKAIALAINKAELGSILNNTVQLRYGLISPAQLCYDEATENKLEQEYGYNLDKAKALLAEAGYKDENGDGILEKDGKPLAISLMVALDSAYFKQVAPMIQAQLQQVGINLELKEYEANYIKQMMYDHKYEMATRGNVWPDPDILYYTLHTEGGLPWSSPETDALLDAARYIMDPVERTAKYSQMQEKVMAQAPIIPLFSEYKYIAARKTVEGLKVSIDGRAFVNDVEKK
ncbi:MAG: ABC transporter substrate-binding protein [Tepidanaerobacteraceae bacterium]|nr:ABC transporter substrate-binding protein [Tepidanaerobacteraceae bacterium]